MPFDRLCLTKQLKTCVAAKSPLTGGYGDGNIGTYAAVQMRKAGYDVVIVEGRAEKPTILHVEDATRVS
jgi:aldehyde:ferredoxin oxidoreductase